MTDVAQEKTTMSLRFKPYIGKLPAYKPPSVPSGVARVVDLSSNENPLGPSPKAVAALRAAAETVHRYPDAPATALRVALADKLGLSPTNVALSNGADEWVILACLALLDPGDEVVVARGTFVSYAWRAIEVGAKVVQVPLRNYVHDLRAMADALTEETRLVFVCNPNNPTGTDVDAEEMEAFLARIPQRVAVVIDEAYYEYANRPSYFQSLDCLRAGQENLIVLRSFSKIYGLAGLRVGYMLAHEAVIDYMDRARPPFNVNRLGQVAALAALSDEEHVRRSIKANAAAKELFYRELEAVGVPCIPSQTNFLAIDVGRPGPEVSAPLLERGFITTAMDAWGVPNHLRFSFGTPDENEAFIAALKEVLGL
jgi:histidinol-phosphate aminotransferase